MPTWVLIAVAVVAVVVKRFCGERVNARDLAGPPAVLVGLGVYGLVDVHLTAVDWAWLVAGSAVGLGLGVARGATVRVFTRDGVPWQRYTPWTLLVWAGSFAVSLALGLAASSAGTPADARPLTLSIGIGLLGEAIPIGVRLLRSAQQAGNKRRVLFGSVWAAGSVNRQP
ncbi:DUF1453 domain-containing protein [Saccharothrix sp. S26]|uniref:DUF1453 domain-containing protein n=1 Tax=Saccharothrix sp. S26 TaxID=2907215 RepID=UPI001F30EBD3|nr:DUF1453 domain-containing protein [Saccharothrix sp. S26]MCE6994025.1 DUF1453 domain-containing protein [Saccharothrix sp. S26]